MVFLSSSMKKTDLLNIQLMYMDFQVDYLLVIFSYGFDLMPQLYFLSRTILFIFITSYYYFRSPNVRLIIVPFMYVDLLKIIAVYIVILHFFQPYFITVTCYSQLKYAAYGTSAIWVTMFIFNIFYERFNIQTWLIPAYFTNGIPVTFNIPLIYLTSEFNS